MENLKKAIEKIVSTAIVVDKALEDKKVNIPEGMRIGVSAVAWVWIFKNFKAIAEEFATLNETDLPAINSFVAEKLELRNDKTEAVVEQALEIILGLMVIMTKTRDEVKS